MPTFDTPTPIAVTLDLAVGHATLTAGERADTVVDVTPSNESRATDVKAAQQTSVEYADGGLSVRAPRQRGHLGFGPGKGASVDVTIELPAGSDLHGYLALGGFDCAGRFGECRLKTGSGQIRLEQAGAIRLSTGAGDITVGRVIGHADVTTGVGEVQIREIDGSAVIKNSAGDSRIGEVTGNVRLKAATGDIVIDRAHAAVEAKTALGKVRIGEVARGSIVLESGTGGLDVGIREGTAAWLDARSRAGSVRNLLDACEAPEQAEETVEVRARTQVGDIVIRRSSVVSDE